MVMAFASLILAALLSPLLTIIFKLNNVLNIPNITKHLLSINKFASDNNIFFKFNPSYFSVKDQVTKIFGLSSIGLYYLGSPSSLVQPSISLAKCAPFSI